MTRQAFTWCLGDATDRPTVVVFQVCAKDTDASWGADQIRRADRELLLDLQAAGRLKRPAASARAPPVAPALPDAADALDLAMDVQDPQQCNVGQSVLG